VKLLSPQLSKMQLANMRQQNIEYLANSSFLRQDQNQEFKNTQASYQDNGFAVHLPRPRSGRWSGATAG